MISFLNQNSLSVMLLMVLLGMSWFLTMVQIPKLQSTASKESFVHPTVRAQILEVSFVEKIVPRAIKMDSGGGYHAKPSWLPEFRYSFELKGKTHEKTWSPDVNEVSEDAFEVIALFGNKKAPSNRFQEYWRAHKDKSLDMILHSEEPPVAEILLGQNTIEVQVKAIQRSVQVALVIALLILLHLGVRGYVYAHSFTLYGPTELTDARVEVGTGSPILSFPVPLESMSRPVWVEVEEKEQVVFVTVYKQTVFVDFDWFDRTPTGRNIYSVRPTFDASQKRYQARLSYQPMTDRRFMLMTSEGPVSMAVVP